MKLNFIIIFLSIFICAGCEADYDIDRHFEDFEPRIVLNSIISPDSEISASLYWSKHYTDINDYRNVKSFEVELYEDGSFIGNYECENGYFYSSFFPQESRVYRLKVTVPNYGEVSAITYIPKPVISTLKSVKMVEADSDTPGNPYRFAHFKMTGMSSKEKVRAAWVMAESFSPASHPDSLPKVYNNNWMYSDNHFTDRLNAKKDFWCSEAKGSSISYNIYIRIPYTSFDQAMPLDFSIETMGREEDTDRTSSKDTPPIPEYTHINIITPSEEYDRYQESLYQAGYVNPFGSGGTSVYSNIRNGLGIFAGYSTLLHTVEIKDYKE